MRSHHLGHFTLTKTILVLLSLIQVDKTVIESSQLSPFLCYLNDVSVKLAKTALKDEKKIFRVLSPKKIFMRVENVFNGRNRSAKKSILPAK